MVARLGAALVAVVLAFAPGSQAIQPAHAAALSGPGGAAVIPAVDICTQYDCYPVSIALSGAGSGRVQSTDAQFVPDGIMDCTMVKGTVDTTKCSHMYPDLDSEIGVVVYILITPDPSSELCDANGCRTEPFKRSRLFTAAGSFQETFNTLVLDVRLAKTGTGTGRITSDPSYLDCGTSCETSLEYGEQLVFTAKPSAGSKFSKWTGDCAGQNSTCEITLTGDITTTAVFNLVAVATAEPTEEPTEPPAEPSPTPVPATLAPTVAPTILPTDAPTPEPTIDPGPATADSGSGPVVILLAIALVGLLGALGFVVLRARKG